VTRLVTIRALLIGLAVPACARYQPAPLDPPAHLREYRTRSLDDTTLVGWVDRYAGRIAPQGWTDRQLAVAGLRLRAEVARARAEWRAALAGERSAGARPAPGANADIERAVSGSGGQPPWVVSVGTLFTFELGGKRGARVQQARAHTTAAEAELASAVWQVVYETRRAAIGVALAAAGVEDATRELEAFREVQTLETQRFAEAAVTSSEVARTSSDVEEARSAVAAATRTRIESRAVLAAAIGVPTRALDSIAIAPTTSVACERLDSIGLDSIQALALTTRPEMALALAGYALAESDVRLQVARQYPDLDLGPGFIWDQGVHRWTLAMALPALLGFRNRAPILEAEARRTAAGARVAETQESILGELALASERCRGTRLEQSAADSQAVVAERSLERAQAAYARGESARLEAALAQLAVARAARARRAASSALVQAGVALEGAGGEWRGSEAPAWPDPRRPPEPEGATP
jgi:outer membrane protein TolC